MRTSTCLAIVAALVLISSPEGWAWGRDGHQVIADLAQRRLSPAARTGVAAILSVPRLQLCRADVRLAGSVHAIFDQASMSGGSRP